jgi:hypothetical protein
VGLSLEEAGKLKGPIRRDPTGAGEFIDANNVTWDVKSPTSRFPPEKGGFSVATDVPKIQMELRLGENVIIDTTDLSAEHVAALKKELDALGLGARVIWWP